MLKSGEKLSERYEILNPLGAGGMGEVYEAIDKVLVRKVAIKILPDEFRANQTSLIRFQREAKALAAISHPNILTIFDFGSSGDLFFAVTEFLQGETLKNRIQRSLCSWEEAAAIGLAVAEGLSAAHQQNIIHRDIKPSNLFLTKDQRIKILDFGLSQLDLSGTGKDLSKEVTLENTKPGTIVGTLLYMSPEQTRGSHVDARSDIFSLGSVMYELLSGNHPFIAQSPAEILSAILRRELPSLSSEHIIPRELELTLQRCLAKDPDKRFSSANDLVQALKKVLEKSKMPQQRNQPSKQKLNSIAVLPFVNVDGDPDFEYLSDGITESIINSLSTLPQLRVMARTTVFRFKGKTEESQQIGHQLNVKAVLTGRVIHRADNLDIQTELVDTADGSQIWGERYRKTFSDIFEVQEQIAAEIAQKLQTKLTSDQKKRLAKRHTHDTEVYQFYLKGRYQWNKRKGEALRKGLENFQRAIELDPNYALAYSGVADSYSLLERYGILRPKDAMPKAKEAASRALALDETLAEAHASMALYHHYYSWDFAQSEAEYRRALQLNHSYASAHHLYGWLLSWLGRQEEAFTEITKAQELDPLSLIISTNIGTILYFGRKFTEALEAVSSALEIEPNFVVAHQWLGRILQQLGRYSEAVAAQKKALDLLPSDPESIASLGFAYALAKETEKAREMLNELQNISQTRYVSSYWFALLYTGIGETDRAFEALYAAVEERLDWVASMNVDPSFDPLRNDSRFSTLVTRIGLT